MQDQAHRLRRLVSRVASVEQDSSRARQVVLSGCKGGVGTTTLVVNLAMAMRKQRKRVLIVDANPARGDIATMLRLNASSDLDDVTEGRQSLRQVLLEGPLGVQVVPGGGVRDGAVGAKVLQLVRQLDAVSHHFDWIFIDAGCCSAMAEFLWPTSDRAIVVGTPDFVSITDAYALIKSMCRKRVAAQVAAVINRGRDVQATEEAWQRLSESCRRFLQLELVALDGIPECPSVREAVDSGRPVLCSHPRSHAVQAIHSVAEQIASVDIALTDFNSMSFA